MPDPIPKPPISPPPEEVRNVTNVANVARFASGDFFPEARVVVWAKIYPLDGSNEITLTVRADTPEEAIDGLVHGIEYAETHYQMSRKNPARSTTSPPTPPSTTSVTIPPGFVPPPPAPPTGAIPPTPTTATPDLSPGVLHSMHIVKIVVTPNPEKAGKMKVELFGNDKVQPVNRFADLRILGTPEEVHNYFRTAGGWTVDHFKYAAVYDNISVTADWEYSTRKSSGGTPYKDVKGIRPG